MKRKGCLAAAVVIAAVATIAYFGVPQYRAVVRETWKANNLAEISRLAADTNWLAAEIATLNAHPATDEESGNNWISDHLVLMKTETGSSVRRNAQRRIGELTTSFWDALRMGNGTTPRSISAWAWSFSGFKDALKT